MKRLLGFILAMVLVFSMSVTAVMASEGTAELEQEEIESTVTIGAEEETENGNGARGIFGYVIIFALMIGISLLRPFLMRRSLRNNYYDERAWGLDKHRKF